MLEPQNTNQWVQNCLWIQILLVAGTIETEHSSVNYIHAAPKSPIRSTNSSAPLAIPRVSKRAAPVSFEFSEKLAGILPDGIDRVFFSGITCDVVHMRHALTEEQKFT